MARLHPKLEGQEFWYDDILLCPDRIAYGERDDVDLSSQFTKNIKLNVGLVSSPMDRTTGPDMLILMPKKGGIGVLHCNYFSVDAQIHDFRKAKDFDTRTDGFREKYPLATLDNCGRLRAFVAVESRLEPAKERIMKAHDAGADGIVIDTGVVYKDAIDIAKYTKNAFPDIEVVVGNIASERVIEYLEVACGDYIDAYRIGVGPGKGCITQEELGIGSPQGSAVFRCASTTNKSIIADGGSRNPGSIIKPYALGAQTVMLGYLLAGLDESPGAVIEENGEKFKEFRGMGSPEAMEEGGAARYMNDKTRIRIAEGKVVRVPYRGAGEPYLDYLIAGIRQGMHKLGFMSIQELQDDAMIIPARYAT